MKKMVLIMGIMIFVASIACQIKSKPNPTQITFLTDLETAKAEAAKTKMPIIIDFYADTSWCQSCRQLDSLTFGDSLVIGMSAENIFVKINAETDSAVAQSYGVRGYPTIIIAKSDGSEIDRIEGYIDPYEFYNQVHLFLQGKETLDDYLTRLDDEPDNPEYLLTIAEKYIGRAQPTKAIEYYHRVMALDPENRRGYATKSLQGIYYAQAQSKDYKTAIETCQDIIKRFPTAPEADDASAMLGYYTALSGDAKGAVVFYREYLQKYPEGRNQWVQRRMADLEEKL
jgi:thioredoxin-like negative regulator of GroEL